MRDILITLTLVIVMLACGKLGHIDHDGTINTVVSINLDSVHKYFGVYCAEHYSSPEDIATCSDNMTAEFLASVTASLPSPSPGVIHGESNL